MMNQSFFKCLIVLLFLAMLGFYFSVSKHCSQSDKEDVYHINENFDAVRKILVRTNALDELVSCQHGEVLHQEWHDLDISADRLVGPWDVNGRGEFLIRVSNPEAGFLVLNFHQTIHIDANSLVSKTFLKSPVDDLKEYSTELTMTRSGDLTRVENRIVLKYERYVPNRYTELMDHKVNESVLQSLKEHRTAILSLIERYSGNRFVIPIKR